MNPASDWLFFCSSFAGLENNSPKALVIDMCKHLKNVARVFTWIEEEGEGLKDGNCSTRYSMY